MRATSYIITWRGAGDKARRANLDAVLNWLRPQELAEVIVVEQDVAPSLGDLAGFPALRNVFAYNPGKFNKSWGMNIGARLATGGMLAFGDGDIVCGSLAKAVALGRAGVPVVRAFKGIVDLDEAQSRLLRADLSCLSRPGFGGAALDRSGLGERLAFCGGLVIFQRNFFALLGGWDERFLGWGGEDDAMDIKIQRAQLVHRLLDSTDGFHLHHRRANAAIVRDADYRNNLALLDQLRTMPDEALKRLCDVAWCLAGHREMHRPMEVLS